MRLQSIRVRKDIWIGDMTVDRAAQSTTPLLTALHSLAHRLDAPFYTPGHKRGRGISPQLRATLGAQIFRADLPELPELDNLFAPQGAIAEAQMLAAAAFGGDRTWFLANGSTCGVIAAILATCGPGEKLILPRSVHQSVVSGLILSGAVPVFVVPEYDAEWQMVQNVSPAAVAMAIQQHPDAKAVLIGSPTYYGVCADVATIADLAHQAGMPLLIDEAHGAHFAFHPDLPTPALQAGADLAVQSIHKTLSALTQAAMLHVKGDRISPDRLSQALQLVQSTSPSYLLLASLDAARAQIATGGKAHLTQTLQLAAQARERLSQISGVRVLDPARSRSSGWFEYDRTRLTVSVDGVAGFTADEILHQQFNVTAELPTLHHLTFIFSIGNLPADVERLVSGFASIAQATADALLPRVGDPIARPAALPRQALSPRQAFFATPETVGVAQAVNQVSAEWICPYPPGIPVLLPGEVITEAAIVYLQQILQAGGVISGCADPTLDTIRIVSADRVLGMTTLESQ